MKTPPVPPISLVERALIEDALRGKTLGCSRLAPSSPSGCRCAIGELAHEAGVSDATLTYADYYSARNLLPGEDAATLAYNKRISAAYDAMLVALRERYGLRSVTVEHLMHVNDTTTRARRVPVILATVDTIFGE